MKKDKLCANTAQSVPILSLLSLSVTYVQLVTTAFRISLLSNAKRATTRLQEILYLAPLVLMAISVSQVRMWHPLQPRFVQPASTVPIILMTSSLRLLAQPVSITH